MKRLNIVVAPLNWGLGHATRCVPLINFFLKKGHDVSIASDGQAFQYLVKEFPALNSFELPSYNIQYPESGNMVMKMLFQLPKIYSAINREHKALEQIIAKNKFDLIISDNRYGMWNRDAVSIFLTHQLFIKSPYKPGEYFLNKINHRFIGRFDQCWIPDFENEKENLSGNLSHSEKENLKRIFIGPLSRFSEMECNHVPEDIDLLVILSGPEPQRTILEKKIISQLNNSEMNSVVVRGTSEKSESSSISKIQIKHQLNTNELADLICRSKIILCRSGYSSIMDLCTLGKKAILIPTPGQTEQEYLAGYFLKRKIFFSIPQEKLNIKEAIRQSEGFTGISVQHNEALLEKAYQSLGQFSTAG